MSQAFLTYVQIVSAVTDTDRLICSEGRAQVEERKHAAALQKHLFEDACSGEGWRFAGVTGEASEESNTA